MIKTHLGSLVDNGESDELFLFSLSDRDRIDFLRTLSDLLGHAGV